MKTSTVLRQLIKYRPGLYLLDFLLAIGGWLLFLVPAYVSKQFFDTLSGQSQHILGVWGLIVLLLTGHIVRIALFLLNRFVDVTFAQTIGALLRGNMLNQIYHHNIPSATTHSSGELITYFREDVDETAYFLGFMYFLDVVCAAVFSVFALIMMLQTDVMITIIVFLPLVAVVLVTHWARERINTYRSISRDKTGSVTEFVSEMFGSVQAIQVANAQKRTVEHFRQINDARQHAMVKENLFSSILNSIFTNVVNVGTGVILLLAAGSMKTGSFTVGDFALFSYYLTWVTQIIVRFGNLTANYNKVKVSVARMGNLCSSQSSLVEHNKVYLKDEYPEIPQFNNKNDIETFQTFRDNKPLLFISRKQQRNIRYPFTDKTKYLDSSGWPNRCRENHINPSITWTFA